MKKLLVMFLSILFLAACSNSSAENTEFNANEKHLENIVLNGVDNSYDSLIFQNGNLTIILDSVSNAIKPETNPEDLKGKAKKEETYKNISISTKGDTYFIKAEDNFSLELKRVGERIFSDEDGNKYQTSAYLD